MKLRPRKKTPTDNSGTVTATIPVLPPIITRLQTPPISEVSNVGSAIARKDRLSELPSSTMDISDSEETVDPVSPTKSRRRSTIAVPAAPLTTRNLANHQEKMTSAVDIASEGEKSPAPPTPNTRLAQARNYLLTENITSDPDFRSRCLQIAEYLHRHRRGKGRREMQLRKEVRQLLQHHKPHLAASIPRRSLPTATEPVMALPAEDAHDAADPFEWTNKLADLRHRARRSPSVAIDLRELTRPLNGGRLPSPHAAHRLASDRLISENHLNNPSTAIDLDRLWAFEHRLPPAATQKRFSLDRRAVVEPGHGALMPREMMDVDWDRDRSSLEQSLARHEEEEDGEGREAQLLVAETPFLQARMTAQIRGDLAAGHEHADTLSTRQFALPRPPRERIEEAIVLARSLHVDPGLPTPSPRTALFRKRKFEQESDSESGEDGMASGGDGGGEGLLEGKGGGKVEMLGALQEEGA